MRCDKAWAAVSEVKGPLTGSPLSTKYQQASNPDALSDAGTALPMTDMIWT